MTTIVLRSRDPHVAAHLSGMAQCVGYLLAAVGPLIVGLIRGWTGSFAWCAVLFVALGARGGLQWMAPDARAMSARTRSRRPANCCHHHLLIRSSRWPMLGWRQRLHLPEEYSCVFYPLSCSRRCSQRWHPPYRMQREAEP
jgi:hypothetical protein